MMLSRVWVVCVVGILALSSCVQADLPVHCLKSDIVGKWRFQVANQQGSFAQCSQSDIQGGETMEIELKSPDVAIDANGNRGFWTMIYDEGVEVRINDKRYFAFSDYKVSNVQGELKHRSFCHKTKVGSFHNNALTQWGCYQGVKSQKANLLSYVSADGQHWQSCSGGVDCSSAQAEIDSGNSEDKDDDVEMQSLLEALRHSSDDVEGVDSESSYEDESNMVDQINNAGASWKAANYDFAGQNMLDVRARAGAASFSKVKESLLRSRMAQADVDAGHDVSDLPKSFDWRNVKGVNYMQEVQNQGSCGSCYAFATIEMLQSRLAIKTKNRVRQQLSVQDVLNCNVYSQGCKGGFPYLASKFAFDFGVTTKSCMPYRARSQSCQKMRCAKSKLKVKSYRYVGGYFGGCTERAMMLEIQRNGPIALGFEVPHQLMHYRSGVFVSLNQIQGSNKWEPTNHAVLAVGWGENEDGTKYWIAKNSWGPRWGENGYFRIQRGRDTANFESMAVSADVMVPKWAIRHQQADNQEGSDDSGNDGDVEEEDDYEDDLSELSLDNL